MRIVRPAVLGRALVAAALAGAAFAVARAGGAQPPPTATAAPAPGSVAEPAVAPEATPPAFGPVLWQELRYSARKFIFGASTALRVETVPASALAGILRQPPAGSAVPLPAGSALALSSTTDLPFGRDERVTLWLDPASGAALGAEKTLTDGSSYHKLLRFTDGGLFTWRSAPASAREEKLGPDGWTRRKEYLTAPPVRPPGGTPVTDAYALLYLVSAARLDRKDSTLRLVILADKGYVQLGFATGGLARVRVTFDESWPGGGRRREGDALVRAVRATGHALDAAGDQEDVDLGFLGMRGELTIYVEVGTGIPVAFSGRAEHVGNLTVRLDRAVLAAAPPDPDPAP